MIRVLNEFPSSMLSNDDHVYEVDKLLRNLARKNTGLAVNRSQTSFEEVSENRRYNFERWRSSVSGYDSVPVPGHWEQLWFVDDYFMFEPGKSTTRKSNGNFELARWDKYFQPTMMPIEFLRDCVRLADELGFEVFKLKGWTIEEHRSTDLARYEKLKVWFRMTAEVVLQHDKDPDSLEPVFIVDDIRSYVYVKGLKW